MDHANGPGKMISPPFAESRESVDGALDVADVSHNKRG